MLTGWAKPFKVNRLITQKESVAKLPLRRQMRGSPGLEHSLLRFNSTYAEFIGRDYIFRGMSGTLGGLIIMIPLILAFIFLVSYFFPQAYFSGTIELTVFLVSEILFIIFLAGILFLLWWVMLRHEFFAYTYYPIRFNRKTRMVHVFRHERFGGVLSVPWDDVFWHVGRGYVQKYLCDVRGHVMDGHQVLDTFAVGYCFGEDKMEEILSLWEFIYRYMEEGPETVVDHPLERLINESPQPTWKNCYFHAFTSMGLTVLRLRYLLAPLFYPLVLSLASMRWLVFRTCKPPVWPPEIEAESRIEPDDPHRWEEPTTIGEFENRPEVVAFREAQERLKGQGRGRLRF